MTARKQTRFDVAAARARYIELGPEGRTYARIAREFRVSTVTIRKWAHREDWPTLALEADQQAAAKALAAAVRTREQRAVQRKQLHDSATDELAARVAAKTIDDAALARLRADTDREIRLDDGEATDRIARPELEAFVRGIIEWLRGVTYVPAKEPQRALAEFSELVAVGDKEAA